MGIGMMRRSGSAVALLVGLVAAVSVALGPVGSVAGAQDEPPTTPAPSSGPAPTPSSSTPTPSSTPPRGGPGDFHTRADSGFATGFGVELVIDHFVSHEGNERCPHGRAYPSSVSQQTVLSSFCYQANKFAGVGAYDTEYSFLYRVDTNWTGRPEPSGYAIEGHVKIVYVGTSELSCEVKRVNERLPAQHVTCDATTVGSLEKSRDPEPRFTVKASSPPTTSDTVYFLGDSVTAGFGYCGIERKCGPNSEMPNNWFSGDVNLKDCGPPGTPDDRCSNNNDLGRPWDAGAWTSDSKAPTVSYPYVIAKAQNPANAAAVQDWAMSGATPANWDPSTGGVFGAQLKTIKHNYVVMTLGANPLLAAYLKVTVADVPLNVGECAASTIVKQFISGHQTLHYAAPLDGELHGGKPGVLRCFDQKWNALDQGGHLLNVYKSLLEAGNRVLVLGYPAGCAWTLGEWQPEANLFAGPAKGYPCTDQKMNAWAGNGQVSQWDQAQALAADANSKIQAVVARAGSETNHAADIRFVLPDQGAWASHQAWSGTPWVFKNDTWVHPNVEGHKQLAATVLAAMCAQFKHWCGTTPSWK